MNSQIDIVNEEDQIISQGEVEEVHQKGLLHRSVHILIVNPQGKFYLRQRSFKKPRYPGYYTTSVGAHVPMGKSYDETAKNSLKEMFGFRL